MIEKPATGPPVEKIEDTNNNYLGEMALCANMNEN
jgi:hypothetical protein